MVSAFGKTILRTVKSHFVQFFAMTAIITLGIAFVTGIGAIAPNMRDSASRYYQDAVIPDIIIKTTGTISDSQRALLNNDGDIEIVEELFSYDIEIDGLMTRIFNMPLSDRNINKIELEEGRFPEKANEILAERAGEKSQKFHAGDTVTVYGLKFQIVGISANPLFMSKEQEPSYTEGKYLDRIFYFDSNVSGLDKIFPSIPVTDIYIKLKAAKNLNVFSAKYKNYVQEKIAGLEQLGGNPETLIFLSLEENMGAALLDVNAGELGTLSYVFPVFFILIAALVVLTTMTRLVEKDRTVIGCYKTLGYGTGRIIFKYISLALMCCAIGFAAGFAAGFRILPLIIYNVYKVMFHLPPLSYGFFYILGLVASAAMITAILSVTLYVVMSAIKQKPAELLRQKAPKKGKRILLERIRFIWKRLKFKYKSTFRNIFRHVRHLLMTVISVAGCVALILAGFGLYDSIKGAEADAAVSAGAFGNMMDSMIFVVIILIASAGLLSIIVTYNLTNVNVDERKKEIASLKVLGYNNTEVAGYIYREIFILMIMGIAVGLPLGYGLLYFVLTLMDSGIITASVKVNWYSWILSILITVFFTVVSALLLYKKITRVDMNASLKSVD